MRCITSSAGPARRRRRWSNRRRASCSTVDLADRLHYSRPPCGRRKGRVMEQNSTEANVAIEPEAGDAADTLTVEVQTVTRSRRCIATLHRDVHADAAAATLAARLQLPANTPYALRSSRTAGFLDDAKTL